jgi:superfamily II DNA helicase RecQ
MTLQYNIAYTVQRYETIKDIDKEIVNIVKKRLQEYRTTEKKEESNSSSRIIVYSECVEHCKELRERLSSSSSSYSVYFAELKDKTTALQDWIDKKVQVIVTTNALELEIDILNVQLVVHVESSFDLLNYAQESSQAGQDGKSSEVIVLIAEDRILQKLKDRDEKLL